MTSCLKVKDPVPQTIIKVGLVSGLGGFNDAGFNHAILSGLQQIAYDFPMLCQARETLTTADFATNINYFISSSYNLIVTSGYDAAQATVAAAIANPNTDFIILDYYMASPPANLLCAVFDVDQSSFPCGFLAAYWALKQNQVNHIAGFVAGTDIPTIRQFSVSYSHGVAYFDSIYRKNVGVLGYFATSFNDSLQGSRLADSLLKQNISTVFTFAGKTGNGALYKVKEAGKYAIGVDVDQYYSIPAVGPVLLTSCMKGLGNMTYSLLRNFYYNHFPGGTIVHGTLDNGGVGIAPFHNFDSQVPDSIKVALNTVISGIKNGTIKTGWSQ
ncbi:MAG: BMP family ABC transporter substrate-binding protein [Bacteroidetes bacterium]|nr:BMP family ABC transporter substrate-binding protein [Bacteroidota bacterium]